MQIQPHYQSLGTLFTGRLFYIPEYQRAYSWQSKQRTDLFNDIERVHKAGGESIHFMATIVGLSRKKVKIAADEFVRVEVVDGQQRLTTLAILLKSLSKGLDPDDATEKKSASEIDELLVKGDDLSLVLLQTNHDASHLFVDYLRKGTFPDELPHTTTADNNLVNAIRECEAFVAGWRERTGTGLIDLLAIVKNRLSVIFHEIEDEAIVYTVFEVLNSRGLDVSWFDKLKSVLMATVFENGDSGTRRATITELHSLWTKIYTTIGVRQGLNRETVTFAGTLKTSAPPSRLLSEERAAQVLAKQCGKDPKKVVALTQWLLQLTQAEDKLLANPRLKGATYVVQARLVALSILLRGFNSNAEKSLLRTWESVTFRIFGIARRDARTKVGDYVRLAWRIANENLTPEAILYSLGTIGEEFPVKRFVEQLRNTDCYQGWSEQLRYFFYRYEEHLAALAGHKLNESQWSKIWLEEPSKSIEHILARSKGSEERTTKGVYVHTLGNLMLLPPGLNSKLNNQNPRDKAASYVTAGLLHAAEVGRIAKRRDWDRTVVQRRESKLIKWASLEWKD